LLFVVHSATMAMEYRFLGRSGLKVSSISLGAWVTYGSQVKEEEIALECMTAAKEYGVNFFDNAEAYAKGNAETVMGNVLKKTNWRRSDIVISTKIFWGGSGVNETGLSRKHIIEGTNASLKRLQLDYVDLIFAHRPDRYTPVEEIVRSFNYLIENGKAFYWGTSEWSSEQLTQAYEISRRLGLIAPTMEQPQYNLLHRSKMEKEYLNLFQEYGLGTTIWSPLASGLLTGKYTSADRASFPADSRLSLSTFQNFTNTMLNNQGLNELEEKDFGSVLQKIDKLKPIAAEVGATLAQLAIAWTVKNPNVSTVITGASKVSQVHENIKALEIAQKLTPEVLEKIEEAVQNKPVQPNDRRKG